MGIKLIALVTTSLVLSTSVNAAVFNTLNGIDYEWLEISATLGMSRDQVETQLTDVNSAIYGYEYASRALVQDLLLSYSSWDGLSGYYQNSAVVTGINELFNDFGVGGTTLFTVPNSVATVDGGRVQFDYQEYSAFYYGTEDECFGPGITCVSAIIQIGISGSGLTATLQNPFNGWDASVIGPLDVTTSSANSWYGSFLVAPSAVPVPAAAWLFGSGLIGLIGIARRKKYISRCYSL